MRVRYRVRRDERGAVLILVSVFAIVAVIFLAFVVDIGNQRQDRRQFTTATDASALDVAQDWADSKLASATYPAGDCSPQAKDYLDRNRADHDGYSCVATRVDGRLGSVTVFSNGSVDYEFGKAVGINEGFTNSATTVRIRSTTGGGLRPFAVCATDSPEFEAWLTAWETGVPAPTDVIIGGPKFLPSNCGANNGNWGMVQLQTQDEGAGNVNGNGLAGVLAKGSFDETITLDQSATGDPETECNKSYETQESENGISCVFQHAGNPWRIDGVLEALHLLKTTGTIFNLPVYGERVDLGGSANGFPVIGFVEVELLSYCGDPSPTAKATAQLLLGACRGGNDNFVHVKLNKLTSGTCCDVNKDNRVLEICDVGDISGDVDSISLLQNCQTPDGTSGPPPSVPDASCTLSSVSPTAQSVTVTDTGASTDTASRTFEVVDPAVCGTMTVAAVGPVTAAGSVSGPVGNVFTVDFPAGTSFTASSATYDVVISEDGQPVDSSSTLTTVPLAPCEAGAPTYAPVPVRVTSPPHKDTLTADLVVTTDLTNPQNCPTLTIKIFQLGGHKVLSRTPSSLGATASATFERDPGGGWKWTPGDYTIQVQRNGALLAGAQTTFTLK